MEFLVGSNIITKEGLYQWKREPEGWECEKDLLNIAGFEDGRRGHGDVGGL